MPPPEPKLNLPALIATDRTRQVTRGTFYPSHGNKSCRAGKKRVKEPLRARSGPANRALLTEGNASFSEVVGADFDGDAVAGEDADVVHTHFS